MASWAKENLQHPYPSDADVKILMEATDLDKAQVKQWFLNARRNDPKRRGYITRLQMARKVKNTAASTTVSSTISTDASTASSCVDANEHCQKANMNNALKSSNTSQQCSFHASSVSAFRQSERRFRSVLTTNVALTSTNVKQQHSVMMYPLQNSTSSLVNHLKNIGSTVTRSSSATPPTINLQVQIINNVQNEDNKTFSRSPLRIVQSHNVPLEHLCTLLNRSSENAPLLPDRQKSTVEREIDDLQHPCGTLAGKENLVEKTKAVKETVEEAFSKAGAMKTLTSISEMQIEAIEVTAAAGKSDAECILESATFSPDRVLAARSNAQSDNNCSLDKKTIPELPVPEPAKKKKRTLSASSSDLK